MELQLCNTNPELFVNLLSMHVRPAVHRPRSDRELPEEEYKSYELKLSSLPVCSATEHALQSGWAFWYIRRQQGARSLESYEKNMRMIAAFNSVEGFWRCYSHLIRPNDLPTTSDYHLFKEGVKPMWEHEANKRGGKWVVRLRKGLASRYWEELLLCVIGEQFDVVDELCGVVVSNRFSEDILSVWNRNSDNQEAKSRIHDRLKRIFYAVPNVTMEYKPHDTSMKDHSNFLSMLMNKPQQPRNSQEADSSFLDAELLDDESQAAKTEIHHE